MKSNNRYLGAAMIAPFIIFIFLGGIYLKGFVFALSAMAMWEFYKALKAKEFKPVASVGYILLTGIGFNAQTIVYAITLIFLSWLCSMVGYDKVAQTITQIKSGKENKE